MIRLALLVAMTATPAAAAPRMSQADCTQAWRKLISISVGAMPDFIGDAQSTGVQQLKDDVKSSVTGTGWCRLDMDQAALPDAEFDSFEWRADGIAGFIGADALPTRFEARIDGLQIERGISSDYNLAFALQRVPDQGILLIESIKLTTPEDREVVATGTIGGAFFNSIGNMQLSLGGLHLTALSLNAEVTPQLITDILPELRDLDMADTISELSFAQLDRSSRTAWLDFGGDMPTPQGELQVDFRSERGLGIGQFGMSQTLEGAEAVAFALSGVQVTVDWKPK